MVMNIIFDKKVSRKHRLLNVIKKFYRSAIARVKKNVTETPKRFNSQVMMWEQSFVFFNTIQVIKYSVAKSYPITSYKVITKYKVKFYDNKRSN